MLELAQLNALNKFALNYGRGWREKVLYYWHAGTSPLYLDGKEAAYLQQLRNTMGPDFLMQFKPIQGEYSRIAYLKKDKQERFTLKRAWFVTAWRLVDEQGIDLVQPWSNTKGQARALAKSMTYYLVETN